MRRGLFGGSFDPIHAGHLHVMEVAHDFIGLNRVTMIPARVSPFKTGKKSASPADRYEMCRLAAQDYPWADVSDYEITRECVSFTVDTLRYFHARCPDDRLYWLMGGDAFLSLEAWRDWKTILTLCTLAVVPRQDGEYASLEAQRKKFSPYGEIVLCKTEILPVSSTQIREMRKKGTFPPCTLPEKVVQYIRTHRLYID